MSSNPLASFHNEFGNHINKEESKNENIMRNANKYEQEYLPEAGILSRVESEKYENVNHKLNIVDVLTKGKGFGSDSSNDGNIPTKLSNVGLLIYIIRTHLRKIIEVCKRRRIYFMI